MATARRPRSPARESRVVAKFSGHEHATSNDEVDKRPFQIIRHIYTFDSIKFHVNNRRWSAAVARPASSATCVFRSIHENYNESTAR